MGLLRDLASLAKGSPEKPRELFDLNLEEISLVDDPANMGAEVVLYKRAAEDGDQTNAEPIGKTGGKTVADKTPGAEELKAQLEKVQGELDSATTQIDELTKRAEAAESEVEGLKKAAETKEEPEDVMKGLPEDVRKRMEDLEKRTAEAEKIAKEEREARQLSDFTKRAETSWPSLPGKPEEKGKLLFKLSSVLEEEEFKQVSSLLTAGEEAMAKTFRPKGADGVGENSALGRLEAIARKMVEDGKVDTYEKAFDLAVTQNKKLYREAQQ